MGCIVTAGLKHRPGHRATNKGHRPVPTGLHTAARPFGRDEQRPVLATASEVVEVNGVLNQRTGKVGIGQHLGQTGLPGLKFSDRHAPIFTVGPHQIVRGPRGHAVACLAIVQNRIGPPCPSDTRKMESAPPHNSKLERML